jgi:hypothetical protein
MLNSRYSNVQSEPFGSNCITTAMLILHDQWRSLWEQHAAWTRMTIESAAFGTADLAQTSARLLRSGPDMGAALRPYYGNAIAAGFSKLITDHLLIAIRLVSAAKKGDTAAATQAEKEWYSNADDIAMFLAGINPYWSVPQWKALLYDHLAMTKAEAVATLTGDYQKSVDTYDQIEQEALVMADAISGGIVKQFPWRFA